MKTSTKPFKGQFRLMVLIFVLLATLMISSSVVELQQSKKELYELMAKQAHSLLESLITASQNTLRATNYLDDLARQRLLDNASLIRILYERGALNNRTLTRIAAQNHIFRIHIFNNKGQTLFSSYQPEQTANERLSSPLQMLKPLFNGEADTLLIGYKVARRQSGYRFAVALATQNRSAIVLNVDARNMLTFKHDIDFGALIGKVVRSNSEILYMALQAPEHILAASGNVSDLEAIEESSFLKTSFEDSTFATRTTSQSGSEIFEAVHPFSFMGETIGLFRIGLSLQPVQDINERIYRRLFFITLILIVIGFILFVYIFTRQRLNILQKQYDVVETYSGNIIDNVSDAIIVFDRQNGITVFNGAAETIFGTSRQELIGKSVNALFNEKNCFSLFEEKVRLKQLACKIGKQTKELLISKSIFNDSEGNPNTVLVIRDLTEQKQMEAQLERQQRLTAMGELASGVAHEIRNPLNTISTIIQQLDKDFSPVSEQEEYHKLARLVSSEVKRINETVQDFLRFSRPEPVQPTLFGFSDFIEELETQYRPLLQKQNIRFSTELLWDGNVFWDRRQIKQVFINILQNAIEAIQDNGRISLVARQQEQAFLEIQIEDDGPGMPEEVRENIFNLYFTTKAKGTGIGLSIVQRIIFEHGGLIHIESTPGSGSVFTLKLPIHIKKL